MYDVVYRPWYSQRRIEPDECPISLRRYWYVPHTGTFQQVPDKQNHDLKTNKWQIEFFSLANEEDSGRRTWSILSQSKVEDIFKHAEMNFCSLREAVLALVHMDSSTYKAEVENSPDVWAFGHSPNDQTVKAAAQVAKAQQVRVPKGRAPQPVEQ